MTFRALFYRLRFFASDAWDEWKHSPGVNLLALATLAAALFLAGLMMLVVGNVAGRVEMLRQDVRVEVYLDDRISAEQRLELQAELESMQGIERVVHVDKREALRRYREWASDLSELIEELETNPLPASFEVFLSPGPDAERLGSVLPKRLADRSGIEEVRFNRDWLRRLEALLDLARVGGAALAMLVFGAVAFVMASVLRLAVYARRDEIDIMLLVGATPSFVRGPFLVAGAAHGLMAAGLALLMIEIARRGVLAYAESGSLALLDLLASSPLPANLSGVVVAVGLLVGLVGSYFAVRSGEL